MPKSYEESVKIWFIRNYGDSPFGYHRDGKLVRSTVSEVMDPSKPVDIAIDYEEGYHYSEYTNADSSVEVAVHYHVQEDLTPYARTEYSYIILRNAGLSMGEIIKEILEISQEGDEPMKRVL